MRKNKIINTLIVIECIITFALLVFAYTLIAFEPENKMDDYVRESALDEYKARATYSDYARHDLSYKFEE